MKTYVLGMLILIIVLASVFSYYYVTASSSLERDGNTIRVLNQSLAASNSKLAQTSQSLANKSALVSLLLAEISQLNTTQRSLLAELATLNSSVTRDKSNIIELNTTLTSLRTRLGYLQEELTLIEQITSLSVTSLFTQNVTVNPNQSVRIIELPLNSKDYFAIVPITSFPSAGTSDTVVGTTEHESLLLNTRSPNLGYTWGRVIYASITQWVLYANNTGPSPVTCTFSLYIITPTST